MTDITHPTRLRAPFRLIGRIASAAALILSAAASGASAQQADEMPLRTADGRIIVFSNFYNPKVQDQNLYNYRVGRLAALSALSGNAEILKQDNVAVSALSLFEPQQIRDIVYSSADNLNQYITRNLDNNPLQAAMGNQLFSQLTPFQARRVGDKVRAGLPKIIESEGSTGELAVRVYCQIPLGVYDFTQEAYPLSGNPNYTQQVCANPSIGMPLTVQGTIRAQLAPFPAVLKMPPEKAEALLTALNNQPNVIVGYDATISPSWNTQNPQYPSVEFRLTGQGPYRLFTPDDLMSEQFTVPVSGQ